MDPINPVNFGWFFKFNRAPTGFALFQSKALRFSLDNDSGRIKNPYKKYIWILLYCVVKTEQGSLTQGYPTNHLYVLVLYLPPRFQFRLS